jgi:hypothetical protein
VFDAAHPHRTPFRTPVYPAPGAYDLGLSL